VAPTSARVMGQTIPVDAQANEIITLEGEVDPFDDFDDDYNDLIAQYRGSATSKGNINLNTSIATSASGSMNCHFYLLLDNKAGATFIKIVRNKRPMKKKEEKAKRKRQGF